MGVVSRNLWVAVLAIVGLVSVTVFVALALLAKGAVECTLIGCESAVRVRWLKAPAKTKEVRVCVDRECNTFELCRRRRDGCRAATGRADISAPTSARSVRPVDVRVEFLGSDGAVIANWSGARTLQRWEPNGSDCEPTCFGAFVDLPSSIAS